MAPMRMLCYITLILILILLLCIFNKNFAITLDVFLLSILPSASMDHQRAIIASRLLSAWNITIVKCLWVLHKLVYMLTGKQ